MKTRKKGKEQPLEMESVEYLSDLDESDTTCKICMAEFLDSDDLKCHIAGVHQDEYNKNNFCKWCFIPMSDTEEFALHVRDYHLENLVSCPYCFRLFNSYSVYKVHKAKHIIIGSKHTISCSNCPCLFKDAIDVTKHEYEHHQYADGIMINHCFPHLSSVLNMWIIKFLKGNITNFNCSSCSYKTTELGEFINHLKICEEVSLVCNNCYKPLVNRKGLFKHMKQNCSKIRQSRKKLLDCSICHKSFPKELIQEHSKNCLKCIHCNKKFNDVSELATHQASHRNVTATLVYCKYCTANFISKAAVDRHVERFHKHELHLYKYKCKTCNEIYKHPKYLFAHYFGKHKELMPFKCRICNKTFKTRKSFTIHIKVIHNSNGTVKFDENFLVYFTRGDRQDVCIHDHDYGIKDAAISNVASELSAQQTSKESIDTKSAEQESTSETVDNSMILSNVNDTNEAIQENDTKQIPNSNEAIQENDIIQNLNSSDDDVPLSLLKERPVKRKRRKYIKPLPKNNRFTCAKCNIRCYTFQHYNRHMSLHSSKISKQCVKCNELFKRRRDLEEHVRSKHSQSQLTDTLKKLLERRKLGEGSISERFRFTIKKVYSTPSGTNLKIKEYNKNSNVTVKNFLENFTRDLDNIEQSKATITVMNEYTHREPVIQLTEVDKNLPKDVEYEGKLKLPIRVSQGNTKKCKIIMKAVENIKPKQNVLNFGSNPYNICDDSYIEYTDDYVGEEHMESYDDEIDIIDDKNSLSADFTPEASHEVSLRESSQPVIEVSIPTTSVPSELKIGCLTPQAPYFNIVPVNEILEETKSKEEEEEISLPDGQKLVNVNPLEHLLAGKNINIKVNKSRRKVPSKDAIKKALLHYKLWKPLKKNNRKKKASTSKDNDNAEEMQSEP